VYKTQERKLKEYINQHGTTPSQGFTPPTSQATLNAINNMTPLSYVGDSLGMMGAMKPPDSPMSAASSTEPSEVSIYAVYRIYSPRSRILYSERLPNQSDILMFLNKKHEIHDVSVLFHLPLIMALMIIRKYFCLIVFFLFIQVDEILEDIIR
jgi:hypothetical protein